MKKPKTKVIKILARELRIHPIVQREIVASKLREITANLNLNAIGALQAVEYEVNGEAGIWIIDGQHRLRAVMESGYGDWHVDVVIHVDVASDSEAAELFLWLNNRASVSPYEKFKNALTAQDKVVIGVMAIAKAEGLKIGPASRDGNLSCVSALQSAYRIDEGRTLAEVLSILRSAWGGVSAGLDGHILAGVALVATRYNGQLDRAALIKRMSKYPGGPSAILGAASGLKQLRKASLAKCIADVLIEMYNSGRRSGQLEIF